jgi:hypothetical protein
VGKGGGVFGVLMFLNPIPSVSLTTQQMDFYYRLYLRLPKPAKKQRSTVLYNHNITTQPFTKTFYSPVQSQYLQPTRYRKRSTFLYNHNIPTQPFTKTFYYLVQSQYLQPTRYRKRSTLLYNHNIPTQPFTKTFYYLVQSHLQPTRYRKRSTFLYNHNISKPIITENVLLSCTVTISSTHPLQKTLYRPVQSQYLQPSRYRKSSIVLYSHNISTQPVTKQRSAVPYSHTAQCPNCLLFVTTPVYSYN